MESPQNPSFQFYKGKRPLQAAEVKAIVRYVKKIKPLVVVSYHSSGREIYWKYGENQLLFRDYILATKLSDLTGYPLADPPSNAIGAGFTDWFIDTFQRPGFTVEICKPVKDTNPPVSELVEEWRRNRYVGFLLAEEMRKQLRTNEND